VGGGRQRSERVAQLRKRFGRVRARQSPGARGAPRVLHIARAAGGAD